MLTLKTIDAHAAGEPLRLIVDGFPSPRGKTMLEKRAWVSRHVDHLRRALMLEPRGHADMYGAILTEPVTPGSHAGVLFMHNEGYSTMCGHGVIAVTTIALERGLIMPGQDGDAVVYDSPAGTIRARARWRGEAGLPTDLSAVAPGAKVEGAEGAAAARVESVSFVNVPSFVLHGGLSVKLASRQIRADVAFGGAFYAIVDSEAVGLPIDAAHLPELRRVGMEIKDAIESVHEITHPLERGLHGIYGTIFTGPPSDESCGSAERHGVRRCRSGSLAVRHRHRSGDGGGGRDGLALGHEAVRARKPDRHAIHRPGVGADGRRRAGSDCARDRGVGVDYRRAHVSGGRRRSAEERISDLIRQPYLTSRPLAHPCDDPIRRDTRR